MYNENIRLIRFLLTEWFNIEKYRLSLWRGDMDYCGHDCLREKYSFKFADKVINVGMSKKTNLGYVFSDSLIIERMATVGMQITYIEYQFIAMIFMRMI